jgi:prepilin peptidase CpaA
VIAEFLILAVFPALLLAAAVWDVTSYTIPNVISLALLATFAALAVFAGFNLEMLGWHLLAGFAGLAAGFTLFAFNLVGGGDAKLFAVTALILGFGDLAQYALLATLLGGGLTLVILALRSVPLPQYLAAKDWVLRLHESGGAIPYGVALVLAAFIILPQTEIFRAAALF